ncbi:MAG: 3'(2'),5'-bisphosphate nucleotidase CysQ [Nitrospirales bacterium]|nr:3'(2'),5'-bisphosphate nucleotidase CysQ [Nitrospirales bacterium]MBA3966680.1 3'(2'),5'-bisphosphate nucleotidase CysQ [Nitrospirales bacterium]
MPDFSREIEIASNLARKAGEVIMNIYKKDFAVMYKGVNDPVTEADQQVNALIVDGLHTHFPQDSIVAEESPLPSTSLTTGRVWYVDPMDGTKEFIARNGEFSIMIGLTIDARTKLGVVYWPTRDHLYAGLTDQMAWIEHNGVRQKLSALESKSNTNISLVTSRSHRSPILSTIKQSLHIHKEQQMGSVGLKIAQIAQGKADVYIEPSPHTKAWDACAPEAILRGAGGCFTDIHGKPIQYGLNNFRNLHGLVGSTPDIHQRVIHALTGRCSSCES